MGMSAFRKMVSCVLMMGFPGSMVAADSGAAMVYAHGVAWVNGLHVPSSSTIFTGDMLQTRSDSAADINAPGSSISVFNDSLVRFDGASMKVEHGGVTVATSKGVATVAGGVRVAPASSKWTEFNVTDTNGTVLIAARKGDLTITDDSGTVTLPQGQQTTRDDQTPQSGSTDSSSNDKSSKKKNAKQQSGAPEAAKGGVLNSTIAIGVGGAAAAGITLWVLSRDDNPVSPSKPN
jgi:hypothetical protein